MTATKGAFGSVVKGTSVPSCGNWSVATKIFKRDDREAEAEWLREMEGEVSAQLLPKTPFLVENFDSGTYKTDVDGVTKTIGFGIVMEAMDGGRVQPALRTHVLDNPFKKQ